MQKARLYSSNGIIDIHDYFLLYGPDHSPAPFFVNELFISAETIKINWGFRPLELFIRHGHSSQYFSCLPYIALNSAITKLVGSSVYGLGLSSAVFAVLIGITIFYLSCEIRLLKRQSPLATIFYWLMHPVLVMSGIAWNSALFPLISVASILFLEKSLYKDTGLGKNTNQWSSRFLSGILCGVLVGYASWAYPPGKLYSILLIAIYSAVCIKQELKATNLKQSRYWLWLSTFFSISSGLVGCLLVKSSQTYGAETRGYEELTIGQESLLHKIGIRFFQT